MKIFADYVLFSALSCLPARAVPVVVFDNQYRENRHLVYHRSRRCHSDQPGRLVRICVGDSAGTGLTVGLYTDVAGLPGTLVTNLVQNGLIQPFANPTPVSATFLPALPTLLTGGTTY